MNHVNILLGALETIHKCHSEHNDYILVKAIREGYELAGMVREDIAKNVAGRLISHNDSGYLLCTDKECALHKSMSYKSETIELIPRGSGGGKMSWPRIEAGSTVIQNLACFNYPHTHFYRLIAYRWELERMYDS